MGNCLHDGARGRADTRGAGALRRGPRPGPGPRKETAMNDDSRLVTTRRSLHGVAELVLAGPQHAQTGEISLRSVPGGFATTHTPALSVVGTEVLGPGGAVGIDGQTPASLAAALGVQATSLSAVYTDGSGDRAGRRARGRRRGGRHDRGRLRRRRRGPALTRARRDPDPLARALRHRHQRRRGQLRRLRRRRLPRRPLRVRRPVVAARAGRLLERALRPRRPGRRDRRPARVLHRGPRPRAGG